MKIFNSILFMLISMQIALCQSTTTNIPLNKGEQVLRFIDLGKNGFVLKTGNDVGMVGKKNTVLHYYSHDLTKIWEQPISDISKDDGKNFDPIVISPDGSYVYHIEEISKLGKHSIYLTQISKTGERKTRSIDEVFNFKCNAVFFCTKEFLYMYAVDSKNTLSPEGYKTDYNSKINYKLIQVSHSEFNKKEFTLNVTNPDEALFQIHILPGETYLGQPINIPAYSVNHQWLYAGNDGTNLFFYLSQFDIKKTQTTIQVVKVSPSGSILNTMSLNVDLAGKYPRPVYPASLNGGFSYCQNHSASDYPLKSVMTNAEETDIKVQLATLEFVGGKFYVYGLSGDTPWTNAKAAQEKPNHSGYFVHIFDASGKVVKQNNLPIHPKMKSNKFYDTADNWHTREMALKVFNENNFEIYIWPTALRKISYVGTFQNASLKSEKVNSVGMNIITAPMYSAFANPNIEKFAFKNRIFPMLNVSDKSSNLIYNSDKGVVLQKY